MTRDQLLRKIADDFDEKYGTKWTSPEQHEAAINHYYRELQITRTLHALKAMFMASDNRPDFIWKLTSACSEAIVGWQRDLQDPFLSEQRKRNYDFLIGLMSAIHTLATEIYKDYRLAYPEGTDAPIISIDETSRNEEDDLMDFIDDWLGVEEVAEMLNIKKGTVYSKVQSNELPYYRPGKKIKFRRDDIQNYLVKTRRKSMEEIQAEARKRTKRS